MNETGLVDISSIICDVHLDIRYATANNFMHRVLYPSPRAFLVREAAEALRAASDEFRDVGLGIVVWDAYRPFSITREFWDQTRQDLRIFVADPSKGSVHNRGCAVDMTLRELSSGTYLSMPTDFDEFTHRSYMDFVPEDPQVLEHRELLVRVMATSGFEVNPREWWHFNMRGNDRYPILDVGFDELES